MRVSLSRRWLAFTLVLPAAGLVVLLRSGGPEEEPRARSGHGHAHAHGPRRGPTPRWAAKPAASGRAEPAARAADATTAAAKTAATGALPATAKPLLAELRPLRGGLQAARAADATTAAAKTAATGALPATAKPLLAELRPLLGGLQAAQEAEDERATLAKRAEIAALIAKDPAAALAALLAELKASEDEAEAGIVLSVLLGTDVLPQAELLAALSDMARTAELPMHRQIALHALGEAGAGDEKRAGEIADLGRRDRDPQVRETAAAALGALADRTPGPVAESAARELVQSLGNEADPRVKTSLIYALRDTREKATAEALVGSLGDADPGVRLAAADMLGDVAAAHRERAVATLAARFAQESEAEVRQTIVTAIVRAGRIAAVPVLEKLDGGPVQPLIDDFLAGLRSGEDNMEKLYAVRFARLKARGEY